MPALCGQCPSACPPLLQENAFNYDKGVLAEILEPIMGKGLIPADLETWKPRRRAIVPSFHKAYIEAMVQMFGRCTQRQLDKFDVALQGQEVSRQGVTCLSLAALACCRPVEWQASGEAETSGHGGLTGRQPLLWML